MKSIRSKLMLLSFIVIFLGASFTGILAHFKYASFLDSSIREKLTLAVETAAVSYDFTNTRSILKPGGEESLYHLEGVDTMITLQEIMGVEYLYGLIRDNSGEWVYIYDNSYYELVEEGDEDAFLYPLDGEWGTLDLAIESKTTQIDEEYETDEWGTFLSAVTPIYDDKGTFILALGADIEATAIEALKRESVIRLILIILGAVAVTMFIAYKLSKIFLKPINEMLFSLEDMASGHGDLTKRLSTKSRDQIGQMTELYNRFLESLSNIIISIKSSVEHNVTIKEDVNHSVVEAENSVKELSSHISETYINMQKLDLSLGESSKALFDITEKVKEFNNLIDRQNQNTSESTDSIKAMVNSLKEIVDIIRDKEESAKKLVQSSNDGKKLLEETRESFTKTIANRISNISEMTNLIAKIAGQTNLLAMNAAIEAAHAGESGKGFAVVADEIRKLAENSSINSKKISTSIKDIVLAIEDTGREFNTTAQSFNVIESEVLDVDTALKDINELTTKLYGDGEKVLSSIISLNSDSAMLHKQSEEIQRLAEIGEREEKISRDISRDVQVIMDDSTDKTRKVQGDMEKTLIITEKLNESSDDINRQINIFKI